MALDPRAAAAQVIADVIAGKSLNRALPPRLARVADRDRSLLQQLCYGTLREQPRLQGLLGQLLNKPLRDKDNDIQALLLCGLYQLEYTRIPDHAAVAATVGAVKTLKKTWARGMANAVLRRYQRECETLQAGLPEWAAASHPKWLYQALLAQWPAAARDMMATNNLQPPMTLRVNTARISRQDYMDKLAARDIAASAGELSAQAVYLAQPRDVSALPGFAEGEVSVQDEAAQLAAPLLQAAAGERILDACAAPGGKACHLLELQPQLAELVAMDIDEERLRRIDQNLDRLGLEANLLVGDATQATSALGATSFDRILADAPCSATGVIRRHPDIKLLRQPGDIDQLAKLQLAILQGLWPLLKPGGAMLYATCSVLAQENDDVIGRFLAACPNAAVTSLEPTWGAATGFGRQLLPTARATDGLYYAMLRKEA